MQPTAGCHREIKGIIPLFKNKFRNTTGGIRGCRKKRSYNGTFLYNRYKCAAAVFAANRFNFKNCFESVDLELKGGNDEKKFGDPLRGCFFGCLPYAVSPFASGSRWGTDRARKRVIFQ
jgi:hypothetical protein